MMPMIHRSSPPRDETSSVPDPDAVVYGPHIADEHDLRLLGPAEGRRLLLLGVGAGHNAVTLARQGARVIGIDPLLANIENTRTLADRHEVRLELHHGDPAELAFVRADTVDLALSVYGLAQVDDLDRVLRQVNRVLRSGSALVCSLPHPVWTALDHTDSANVRLARPYHDHTVRSSGGVTLHPRTMADVFQSFGRANFRVDTLLEPVADRDDPPTQAMRWIPPTFILRGRKEGT